MLLEIKDLIVHYGAAEAVHNVSLQVAEGSIVTLLGANGAGKSTILRTISGLRRATSGEIWYQGERIDHMRCEDIAKLRIGHCPEGRRLFPQMSVLENLLMGAFLRNDKKDISRDIESIYQRFPILKERSNQKASKLSGGQQQILAMARVMMSRPKLLLLDEPSLGLSPMNVNEICKIIKDIHSDGVSVLLVEQNSSLGLNISQYAYILETGSIALQGKPSDLLSDDRVRSVYLGM